MVGLYSIRLKDVRINCALSEECYAVEFSCLFSEYIDELLTDDLALCFRIINPCKLVEESVDSIYIDEICAKLFPEYPYDFFGLTFSDRKSVVWERV